MAKRSTDADQTVDSHVGWKIRLRRTLLGLSQAQLAEQLGVTFQQLQKYEKGVNRVSASKLYRIAQALHAPVDFFFEGMEPVEGDEAIVAMPAPDRLSLEMTKSFLAIQSRAQREALAKFARALAA